MNSINITGNIGKDPELKQTSNGKQFCNFSVAVRDRFDKEKTDWFNVTVWGKQAEFVSKYLGKGRMVAVSGRMSSREYEGKTYWDLVADDVQGLDKPKQNEQQSEDDGFDPFE